MIFFFIKALLADCKNSYSLFIYSYNSFVHVSFFPLQFFEFFVLCYFFSLFIQHCIICECNSRLDWKVLTPIYQLILQKISAK